MAVHVAYSGETAVQVGAVRLVYDSFGDPGDPPLLLIAGLGSQLISWDEAFCAGLAAQGLRVIRFDNRDSGLATHFRHAGSPDLAALLAGDQMAAPYTLDDMAADTAGLLDALAIEAAHIAGASMGGMIAQTMAIACPERVRTLTSIMSVPGVSAIAGASPDALALLARPAPTDRAGFIASWVESAHILGGGGTPVDEAQVRQQAGRAYDRSFDPTGVTRQLAAIIASGDRDKGLSRLAIPALIIHGRLDPLLPVEAGIATARLIPGARLHIFESMGHNLPEALWPQIVGLLARQCLG